MGDKQNRPFQLSFNGLLKIDFQGSRITSDGGLILVRELDERLGVGELVERTLIDSRAGTHSCHWPACFGSRFTAGWLDTKM